MLPKKSPSHFIEFTEQEIRIARASSWSAPLALDELRVIPAAQGDAWEAFLVEVLGKKGRKGGYVHARCGVYPPHRFVRRVTIDPRRFKETGYLNEVVTQQLRVDPDSNSIAIINPVDGVLHDGNKPPAKDVLFAGAPTEEFHRAQDQVIERAIYPQAIELNTLAALGAAVDLNTFCQWPNPTLVLDLGHDVTHLFIVSMNGVESTRSIQQGLGVIVPSVMKELGLKDEEAARRVLASGTFDFSSMGPALVKRLITELQSSIGFYEVQTGQSIGQLLCLQLPSGLQWLEGVLISQLGLSTTQIDWSGWLAQHRVSLSAAVKPESLGSGWLGLLGLLISSHGVAPETKA